MSRSASVRRWVAEDVNRIGWVHSRSRQQAYAGLVPPEALAKVTPEEQARVWRARMDELVEPYVGVVAEVDGVVVGFALGELDAQAGAELTALHVLPEQQGTGVGRVLMEAVMVAFGEWGVDQARLHVIEGNEQAQEFYGRSGWHLHGSAGLHEVGGARVPVLEYRFDVGSHH